MKLWIRSYALFCPAQTPEEIPVVVNTTDGTLNVGDTPGVGEVISMQPDGTVGVRPSGTKGPWEVYQSVPGINLLAFTVNGLTYKVPVRGR